MIKQLLILSLITLIPLIELRLAIPLGIITGSINLPYNLTLSGFGLNPLLIFGTIVTINILLGIFIFHFLHIFDEKLKKTKFAKPYIKLLEKSQRKIHKYVNKYGKWGLLIFIGLPLPGSGVYTGSVAAFMLGMEKKDFYLATILGVIMAGLIVTIITLGGIKIF